MTNSRYRVAAAAVLACAIPAGVWALETAIPAASSSSMAAANAEPAGAHVASASRPRTEILNFLDVRSDATFLDLGRRGGAPSPGDTWFFTSRLSNPHVDDPITRRPLGSFLSTCTNHHANVYRCLGTLLLADGAIELSGSVDFAGAGPLVPAVTGGTGRYSGVGGAATITPTGTEGVSRLVVRLQR